MADGVRLELVSRIDAIGRHLPHLGPADLATELEQVRRLAAAEGIGAAVAVVHALDSALARGERGPLIRGWLAILRDAVDCGMPDARACETFAAACSVRLTA